MKYKFIAALAAGLFSAGPAFAAYVVDFDGPTSFLSIDQYYNGGTDQGGLSGPNLGVSFGLDALGLQNDGTGSGINGEFFTHAPSPIGIMTPVGSSATMNVATGFNGVASFYYSSVAATSVSLWSGYDGTGTLLHTFALTANAQDACSDSGLCNWTLASFDVGTGTVARSITFGDAANIAGFDNVTINAVPEPGSFALLGAGLAGMGLLLARRKKTSV